MDLRRYRMGLIQTADQLRFSYLAVVAGTRRIGNGVPDGTDEVPTEDNDSLNNSSEVSLETLVTLSSIKFQIVILLEPDLLSVSVAIHSSGFVK